MSSAADTSLTERRQSPRVRMALTCTLRQRTTSPIWAETIDVGEGGMSVRAARPLHADALVDFDLAAPRDEHVTGRARVTRLHSPRVYGLRFEGLGAPMRELLHDLVQER
ncbi:MAG: PilZ domain, partial [Solirubrobacteraceae bacterium]|nr:PilZ domain [Solirubrobacteraceae bacterium]